MPYGHCAAIAMRCLISSLPSAEPQGFRPGELRASSTTGMQVRAELSNGTHGPRLIWEEKLGSRLTRLSGSSRAPVRDISLGAAWDVSPTILSEGLHGDLLQRNRRPSTMMISRTLSRYSSWLSVASSNAHLQHLLGSFQPSATPATAMPRQRSPVSFVGGSRGPEIVHLYP